MHSRVLNACNAIWWMRCRGYTRLLAAALDAGKQTG